MKSTATVRRNYVMHTKDTDDAAARRMQLAIGRHDSVLRRFLMRALKPHEDADDVMQEVYMRLFKQQKQGAVEHYPRSYLFVTATNIIRDRRRRDRVKERAFTDPLRPDSMRSEPCDPKPSAEADVIWKEGIEIVGEALRDVKPEIAEIFTMRWGEGLTFPEISKRTGIPIRTVERYASHALAHCRRALEKRKWQL
ncbi:MAG: sigma-70 family RNA polymerase sigma factor [Alphaproteobacteria bacterium]|nr:sigma-70 family RNA polymerase sigma factor [Alphaproteobacteria bacterium]